MDTVITEAGLTHDAGRSDTGRAAAAHDAPDLGAVFDEHASAMYRTILAYTGGRGDLAEEAVAEAFARAAAHDGNLRDPAAWLYRVAFNVANDELRQEQRRPPIQSAEQITSADLGGLFEALRTLPLRERAAMVLFYVLDLPVSEVASRMGIAAPTVRVHLTKGRRRLRGLLGDDEVSD